MYSAQVLDHFENPRNAGDIASPDAIGEAENPVCGDVVRLTLRIAGERIVGARFKAKGCVVCVSSASALTEAVTGKSLSEARSLRRDDLSTALGGLPQASTHAAQLAIDVLKAALRKYDDGGSLRR